MSGIRQSSSFCWRGFFIFLVASSAGLVFAIGSRARSEEVRVGFDEASNEGGLPGSWQLLGNPRAEEPEFRVVEDEEHGPVLRFHAKGNQSDGVYRPIEVDLSKTPYINFSWKVTIHPEGEIGTAEDDQAVQVQLNFGRYRFKRRVLSYGFDPAAEAGRWYDDSSLFAINRVMVLDSGDEKLGRWIHHSRNLTEDYRECYRSDPPSLENISIFCDSNDSDSESLGYCTAIHFSEKALNRPDEAE